MTDQLLNILKYALLALLYLFFARVLWAVWSEVRAPKQADLRALQPLPAPTDPTEAAVRPRPAPPPKPVRGRRGNVGRLTVVQPKERRGASWALTHEISVGRADTCTIGIVDDAFVSQLHARIFRKDEGAWLEDLDSTNGTYLNGRRITTIEPLAKGDRVQVGGTVLEAE